MILARAGTWLCPGLISLTIFCAGLGPPAGSACPSRTQLRVATSTDGVNFQTVGALPMEGAAHATVVRMSDDRLLVVFERGDEARAAKQCTLMFSESLDDGDSWSTPKPLELPEWRARRAVAVRPVVTAHEDKVRLYFAEKRAPRADDGGEKATRTTIYAGDVNLEQNNIRLDKRVRLRLDGADVRFLMAPEHGGATRIYAGSTAASSKAAQSSDVLLLLSHDGRRFERGPAVRMPGAERITLTGSIVALGRGLRAYVSERNGIVSYFSEDGVQWRREVGVRLAEGRDPAVVRLNATKFLMIYTAETKEPSASTSVTLHDSATTAPLPDGASLSAFTEKTATGAAPADDSAVEETAPEPSDEALLHVASASHPTTHGGATTAEEMDGAPVDPTEIHPPLPEYGTESVDYIAWMREHFSLPSEINAYYAYQRLIPQTFDAEGQREGWPTFRNMFADGTDYRYAPWNPIDFPHWEQSYQQTRSLLMQYREAALLPIYANPWEISAEQTLDIPDETPLLLSILLPHLGGHRDLAKAEIAAGWRAEEGRVSQDRMIESWETVLQGAAQLRQGVTLIEYLVGVAESSLVQHNARYALQQDVFDEEGLERALDTLRRYDRDVSDPAVILQGEHAFILDITQYLFTPRSGTGALRINDPEVRSLFESMTGSESPAWRPEPYSLEDGEKWTRDFDRYYREIKGMMRIGYPYVREDDIQQTYERYHENNALSEMVLPALGRYHKLRARNEAARRATQLSYAVHLFEKQHGRFPASLMELPPEYAGMRVDPFTGMDFGYRLEGGKPRIYSLSENGLDDGGVHSRNWDDNTTESGGSDDHVFWPPAR